MNDNKHDYGHPYLDAFRLWHKKSSQAPSDAYGIDIDYVMIGFDDNPIKCVIDFKRPGDSVTRTEEKTYNHLEELGIPVFVVTFFVDYQVETFEGNKHPNHNTHDRVSFKDEDVEAIKIRRWNTDEIKFISEVEDYWKWEKKVRER